MTTPMTFAAALAASAAEQGLALEVIADQDEPFHAAEVPSSLPLRNALGVGYGPLDRLIFGGWGDGFKFIDGHATDMGELARVAHAWQTGLPVRQIHALAPNSELGPLAEAAEQGPAEFIAEGWRRLLARAASHRQQDYSSLVECAYAEERLRPYFPLFGMWSIRFLAEVLPSGRPLVEVEPARKGFTVTAGDESWSAATAQEAIALVLRALPAGTE